MVIRTDEENYITHVDGDCLTCQQETEQKVIDQNQSFYVGQCQCGAKNIIDKMSPYEQLGLKVSL